MREVGSREGAGGTVDLGRVLEACVDRRCGALWDRLVLEEGKEKRSKPRLRVSPQRCGDHPWVQARRRDLCPLEAPGQLLGEQDVGQLRLAVRRPRRVRTALLVVQVVQVDLAKRMRR